MLLAPATATTATPATPGRTPTTRGALAVVGGHPLVVEGVTAALATWWQPVPLAQLPRAAAGGRAVVVDLTCGHCSLGTAAVRRLASSLPVVLLVAASRVGGALELLEGGGVHAVGAWEPTASLRAVVRGAALVGPAGAVVTDEVARATAQVRVLRAALTSQEREALRLYASDLPAKTVARRMGVSETTTKEYLRRVRVKVAEHGQVATTKLELRRLAEQLGLAEDVLPCRPG